MDKRFVIKKKEGEEEHRNREIHAIKAKNKTSLRSYYSFLEGSKILRGLGRRSSSPTVFLFSNNSLDPPPPGVAVVFNAKFIATTPACAMLDT